MFNAYCKELNKIIYSTDIINKSYTFLCPNPLCSCKLFARNIDGFGNANFARYSKDNFHIKNCLYSLKINNSYKNVPVDNFDIESIFYRNANTNITTTNSISTFSTTSNNTTVKINTPKKLFNFCIQNPTDRYINDIYTISDIFVDNRNIYSNFIGFTGIKMILATTVKFDKSSLFLKISSHSNSIFLNIKVNLSSSNLSTIIKFILENNNGKFSSFPIAILGDWHINSKYNIACGVKNIKHILYNLKS